jgi:mannose-1-phosphate guanylyltransferase
MKSYAIIMAGGVGARFWPYGSQKLPKQFLPIANSADTMIQLTVKRIRELIPMEQIFIVTNAQYVNEVKKQVSKIPSSNIIGEPVGRNTAPCVGLASIILKQFDERAKMVIVPADHLIEDEEEFLRTIKAGLKFVEDNDSIVTLGINPTHPETGYGYIQFLDDKYLTVEPNGAEQKVNIYKVKTFAEKPTLETAKEFLESGDFLWNSGMFIFRADVILKEIKQFLPDLHHELLKIEKDIHSNSFNNTLDKVFRQIKSISIDYGVMEKANNVYVIKGNFKWSDLGSWDEVSRIKTKDKADNVIIGDSYIKDSKNNLVLSSKGFVGLIGVDDLIVINTKEGLLICRKGRSQEVKEVVDYLKRKGLTEYL